MKKMLAVLLIAAMPSLAQKPPKVKARDWQTGKVLDSERESYVSGSTTTTTGVKQPGAYSPPTYGPPVSNTTAHYAVYQTYVIEGEKYVYVASERLSWRWSKPAMLIVNAPVRYAIEKRKLFLIDEDGKEHEAAIEKQILRPPPEAKQ